MHAPVFPLNTVLFPGMHLPLRIFEPRYTDMVGHCLRESSPFAVCLIREGSEVGAPARFETVGTLATIDDWQQLPGGLLGIRATGRERIRVLASSVAADNLAWGDMEVLPAPPAVPVPADLRPLPGLLAKLRAATASPRQSTLPERDDVDWVGYRLCECLPLDLSQRQALLEMDDGTARLRRIWAMLRDAGWTGPAEPGAP